MSITGGGTGGPSEAFDFPGSYASSELAQQNEARLTAILPADRKPTGTHRVESETTVSMFKVGLFFCEGRGPLF